MRLLKYTKKFLLLLIIGSSFFACGIFDDDKEGPASFSMVVIPEHMEYVIPGQVCVFLVSVTDEGYGKGREEEVTISANNPVGVESQTITPGQVAEVILIPDETGLLEGTVIGEREGLKQTETITMKVSEGTDGIAQSAIEMRNKFIPWLVDNRPELGITDETDWNGTIVKPGIVVVSFYLFFSEDWEMGVTWHVTRPPDNWTRIYLRRRYSEMYPLYGFEISSWSTEGEEPHTIDPEDPIYFMTEVWR